MSEFLRAISKYQLKEPKDKKVKRSKMTMDVAPLSEATKGKLEESAPDVTFKDKPVKKKEQKYTLPKDLGKALKRLSK